MYQPSALCASGTHHVKSYAESCELEEVMCGSDATNSPGPLTVHIQVNNHPLWMTVFAGDR